MNSLHSPELLKFIDVQIALINLDDEKCFHVKQIIIYLKGSNCNNCFNAFVALLSAACNFLELKNIFIIGFVQMKNI